MSHAEVKPIEVRAPRDARQLEISWSDGSAGQYLHLHLRAFCPCATCQGHQGAIAWAAEVDQLAEASFELVHIEPVGHYALRFAWGDGHHTGIYSFRYLRELQEIAAASDAELRQKRFARG